MKQTAVEWLVSNMPNIGEYIPLGVTLEFQAKIEQAKAMEKEQIGNAYVYGSAYGINLENGLSPNNYYTETYESKTNL